MSWCFCCLWPFVDLFYNFSLKGFCNYSVRAFSIMINGVLNGFSRFNPLEIN